MIRQVCDSCSSVLKIPDKFENKTIKCPKCSQALVVSSSPVNSAVVSAKKPPANKTAEAINTKKDSRQSSETRSKHEPESPDGVPATYHFPWFDPFIGLLMVGLAIGYIVLIVGIIAGVIWHTFYNYKNIIAIGDEASFLVFVIYLGIIILGLGIAFFLLKPILARRQKTNLRQVSKKSEPVLFMLLNDISKFFSIGRVTVCELDHSLNVSARHIASQPQNEMILKIGFPILVNMTQQQAAALISLELVEKSLEQQSPVARTIRWIHEWFFDAAQIRDSWDHWLSRIRSRRGFFSTPIVALVQFCVFLNRRVLWGFFVVSQFLSNLSFRSYYRRSAQYILQYVGDDAFLDMSRDLQAAKSVYRATLHQFVQSYHTPQAVDDIAGLAEAERKRMDESSILALEMRMANSWTKPWESRPNLRACQRLAAMAPSKKSRSYFGSAKQLFTNFKLLSRKMTADIHRLLMMGDFVQVREFDRRTLNIALVKRLPTGMTSLEQSD